MRKIVSILLIFLLISSPALAAGTTDSMIGYSAVKSVDSATVKAASVYYNYKTDSYTVSSYTSTNLNDYAINDVNTLSYVPDTNNVYDSGSPYYGVRYSVTGLDIDAASTLMMDVNNLMFFSNIKNDVTGMRSTWPAFLPSMASPYKAYVAYTWSGSGYMPPQTEEGSGSWISISNQSGRSDVSVTYSNEWFLPADYGLGVQLRPAADYQYSMSFDIPATYTKNGYTYEVRNANIDSAIITVVYPYTVDNMYEYPDKPLSYYGYNRLNVNGCNVLWRPLFCYDFGNNIVTLSTTGGQSVTNQVGGMIGQVQQSIGKLGQTINQGFTDVKNTITQGAAQVGDKIDSQTTEIKKGFADIIKGITDLPDKIGEMLQGLIVPDGDKIGGKFEEVKDMAEEKLGIIYQAPEMVFQMADAVTSGVTNPQNTMTLPQFDIIVPEEGTFTVWQEYEFEIMPDELSVIADAIKTITSLICVIAMINAIKRRYERWLNGQ